MIPALSPLLSVLPLYYLYFLPLYLPPLYLPIMSHFNFISPLYLSPTIHPVCLDLLFLFINKKDAFNRKYLVYYVIKPFLK